MGMKFTLSLFLFLIFGYQVTTEKVIVCYYGTWATYRSGLGKFDVSHINPDLCTHLVYTFVGIDNVGTVISLDPYLDLPDNYGRDNFGEFAKLKQKNPNLKTLLAVGGWNEGSAKYSVMAANQSYRNNFINSAIEMVLKHNFDGFDLDWEYPGRRDTVHGPADIDNFSQLLREMREEFNKYNLLLTAAVSAVEETSVLSYDIPTISQYLDYIHIMAYDMYGAWDDVTGHNAPLHRGEGDEAANRESLYTVDVSVEYWLSQGCPPEKLVLGVPFYGRTFTLTNANVNSVRASASGAGIAGTYTATSGFIGYNEICDRLQKESWTVRYDSLAKVPYAILDRNWVSYDDVESIITKVEFGLSHGLAGIMLWSIETDDFNNVCGYGDFPLLRAINKALGGNDTANENTSTTSTIAMTTTTTALTTTTTPLSTTAAITTSSTTSSATSQATSITSTKTIAPTTTSITSTTVSGVVEYESTICDTEGYTADPSDCSSFYVCTKDSFGNLTPVQFKCPADLHWDQRYLVCNHAFLTSCTV